MPDLYCQLVRSTRQHFGAVAAKYHQDVLLYTSLMAWVEIAVTTGVGVAAGLLGAAIGPMLTTRSENRAWLREKRAEIVEGIAEQSQLAAINAFNVMSEQAHVRHQDVPTGVTEGQLELMGNIQDALAGFRNQSQVYLSQRLTEAVERFCEQVRYIFGLLSMGAHSGSIPRQIGELGSQAKDLIVLIRKEIGARTD